MDEPSGSRSCLADAPCGRDRSQSADPWARWIWAVVVNCHVPRQQGLAEAPVLSDCLSWEVLSAKRIQNQALQHRRAPTHCWFPPSSVHTLGLGILNANLPGCERGDISGSFVFFHILARTSVPGKVLACFSTVTLKRTTCILFTSVRVSGAFSVSPSQQTLLQGYPETRIFSKQLCLQVLVWLSAPHAVSF